MVEQSVKQDSPSMPKKDINPEQFFAPAAIGLGILLVVGGLILGLKSNDKKIAQLPSFSPQIGSSPTLTSPEPVVDSPTERATLTPLEPAKQDEVIASNATPTPEVMKVKRTVRKAPEVTPYSPPNTDSLSWYTPVQSDSLPDYQVR